MSLNFNQYAAEGNSFIKEYAKEMNLGKNHDKAGRILISILHALRDLISPEESLQFISQFPMFLKAVYVNRWKMRKKHPKVKHMNQFIELIRTIDGGASEIDFESDEVAEQYIDSTFIFLRKYISLGEMEDIRSELPKDLKSMIFNNNIMFL